MRNLGQNMAKCLIGQLRNNAVIRYTFVRTILSGYSSSPLIWSIGYCQSNYKTREGPMMENTEVYVISDDENTIVFI